MKIVLAEPLTIKEEIQDSFLESLREMGATVVSYHQKPQGISDWVERLQGAEVAIVANTPFPVEALDELPDLRYVDVAFTGLDHLPLSEMQRRGIRVSNAAGYSDSAVAELVLGMTINLLRFVKDADIAIRKGGRSADFLGRQIEGKRVGIIGTGHIGLRTAQLFQAFGAEVVAYSRTERPKAAAMGIVYTTLNDLLETSDIVSLHLPLNEETRGFLKREHFCRMKKSAVLINCARGPILDNKALAASLKAGELAAAAIDVFDEEPPLERSPYFSCENVLLTPHVAYFTEEAMERRARIVFENAKSYVEERLNA